MGSIRMPPWLRMVLVAGAVILLVGAGLFGYRWYARPTTLTIAVGSLDGEAGRVVSAIASRFAASNGPVRLKITETSSAIDAAKAFSSGSADLAVVRGDVGDLSQAQAVVIVARSVALLIAPPGSSITELRELKRTMVGVIGGETNRKLTGVLMEEYDLGHQGTKFKDLALADARRALDSKEVRALLVVVPLTDKYLALVRGLFQQTAKTGPVLIPIDSAGAIAEKERAYESFDVPKGTLRGSPPLPAEDLTTLRVSYYLVAKKTLDADVVTALTQSLMNARRDLLGEMPILAQVAGAATDSDAYLPAHPGAAAFYNGTQVSFLDKWGNAIFLAPMIFGALLSILAAAWKFLRPGNLRNDAPALDALYAIGRRIRATTAESELSQIEREIDTVLQNQRARAKAGDENALDGATLNVAAHRLQSLIHDRRALLAGHSSSNILA
jgi:TRAP-type uncharacterized transport system substrate-binding protein